MRPLPKSQKGAVVVGKGGRTPSREPLGGKTRGRPRKGAAPREILHVFPLVSFDGWPGIFDGLAPAPTHPKARQLGSEGATLRGGPERCDDPPGGEVDQGKEVAVAVGSGVRPSVVRKRVRDGAGDGCHLLAREPHGQD